MVRVWMVLLLVLFLSLAVVGWSLGPGMEQRFVPGVWIWDVSLGGMTPAEARAHLEAALPLHQPNIVIVGPEGQRWSFSPADLGVALDAQATLSRAYAIGHSQVGSNVLLERLNVMLNGVRQPPVLSWNARQAAMRLRTIADGLDRPAQDARIRLQGTELTLDPGDMGRQMEITPTLELLLPHLFALEPAEIVPVVTELAPQISDDEAERALGVARAVLAEPLTLLVSDPRAGDPGPWTVTPDVMAGMLVVRIEADQVWVGLDEAALTQFLGPLSMALYRDPVNATFRFDAVNVQLIPVTPSSKGREMDSAASVTRINEMLRAGEHFVPLVIHEIAPGLPDTVTAEELGIRELIAVGESYFTGSSSARDKNIRLGSSKFDGILIAPGQTFSFNEYLGDVTPEAGYDESYVIIGNRTVPGVGGGICQVATTAFRAAYYAGYPIVERWAHAYRVGYYELSGFGPGFDATVYSPLVDLRFTNDTPYYLLIQTEVDAARARLRFLFYSTKDGRTVEQIGPEWGAPLPPGPPVYEYDPTMPAGTVAKLESAHDGLKATLGRIVRDAEGNTLYRDMFVSNFIPWAARYRYGPDFIPPPDAEIVTPQP